MRQEFKGKFQLNHGCVRLDETITSRDNVYTEYFDTEPEAKQSLQQHSQFYERIGYKVLFSNIREWDPEKKKYL